MGSDLAGVGESVTHLTPLHLDSVHCGIYSRDNGPRDRAGENTGALMNKNDLVMIGVTLALMLGEAQEEARKLEEEAKAGDYNDYETEIARHEARGYEAGIEAAFHLIRTKVEQAA